MLIFSSINSGLIVYVLGSGSTSTGIAPLYDTANAVAINVLDGIITSSPAPIFSAFRIKYNASSPLPTPIQYLVSQYFANSSSNFSTSLPLINQFLLNTASKVFFNSLFIELCIIVKSTNGIFIIISPKKNYLLHPSKNRSCVCNHFHHSILRLTLKELHRLKNQTSLSKS